MAAPIPQLPRGTAVLSWLCAGAKVHDGKMPGGLLTREPCWENFNCFVAICAGKQAEEQGWVQAGEGCSCCVLAWSHLLLSAGCAVSPSALSLAVPCGSVPWAPKVWLWHEEAAAVALGCSPSFRPAAGLRAALGSPAACSEKVHPVQWAGGGHGCAASISMESAYKA